MSCSKLWNTALLLKKHFDNLNTTCKDNLDVNDKETNTSLMDVEHETQELFIQWILSKYQGFNNFDSSFITASIHNFWMDDFCAHFLEVFKKVNVKNTKNLYLNIARLCFDWGMKL